ncbi:MAG TPA: aminopeptidase [Gaiellaceae bacterium]|jgi:aminopeptidase|nr:aminopeptidase [Gaiellaceae bacterium]
MDPRFAPLAELAVWGVNLQPDQVLVITAEHGEAEAARAVAAAAYRRGARFVQVNYFDPHVKRARIEYARAETLEFVPAWLEEAALAHAEGHGARIVFAGMTEPNIFEGLDPERLGKDQLPRLSVNARIVSERLSNWCGIAAPHPAWATVVFPAPEPAEAYERLWAEIEHVLRLDEPDPVAAWEARLAELREHARILSERRFDAIHLQGPGTDLTIGLLPSARWWAADFTTAEGLRHVPNLPTEEVFTTPDPARADGFVTSTKPLALMGGATVRGLRVRFEGGRAVEIDADENGDLLRRRLELDSGGERLGELALVDGSGRIGPLETTFFHTLLDENAASHIALGNGFPFLIDDELDRSRVNVSSVHVDFMVGSPEVEVTGITAAGDRVAVLRGGAWAF